MLWGWTVEFLGYVPGFAADTENAWFNCTELVVCAASVVVSCECVPLRADEARGVGGERPDHDADLDGKAGHGFESHRTLGCLGFVLGFGF